MFEIKREYFTKNETIRLIKYQPRKYGLDFYSTIDGCWILAADGYKSIKEAETMLYKFRPNAIKNPYTRGIIKRQNGNYAIY